MKLNESQHQLLNELLAMVKHCYDILVEVKKDIIQEELLNKIEIENKARTEQRKLDENYIESLKRYNDRNNNKVD